MNGIKIINDMAELSLDPYDDLPRELANSQNNA